MNLRSDKSNLSTSSLSSIFNVTLFNSKDMSFSSTFSTPVAFVILYSLIPFISDIAIVISKDLLATISYPSGALSSNTVNLYVPSESILILFSSYVVLFFVSSISTIFSLSSSCVNLLFSVSYKSIFTYVPSLCFCSAFNENTAPVNFSCVVCDTFSKLIL